MHTNKWRELYFIERWLGFTQPNDTAALALCNAASPTERRPIGAEERPSE